MGEFNNNSFDSPKSSINGNNKKEKEEYTNIGAGFSAAGSVLTLSIHAKQENVIKMYLFCNGQCIRFMPSDIRVVLPILFNMDESNPMGQVNAFYMQGTHVDEMIQAMEGRIIDDEFAAFRQSYM